jgi:integrase
MEKLRSSPWGDVMVRDVAPKHVRAIIADIESGHAKKHWLKTMRALFAHATEIGQREDDPSIGIKVKGAGSDGYWTWLDEEIAQYRAHWPLGTAARLTLELALETASRRVELCQIGRQHLRGGRISIRRAKGCNGVSIPVSPELSAALDATPSSDHLTLLVTHKGEPYAPDQLGLQFARWATAAGLPQRCRLHGLRKARSAQLATAGASTHEIMAVTGHKSLPELQRYAAKYDRSRAADAAMARLLRTGTEL